MPAESGSRAIHGRPAVMATSSAPTMMHHHANARSSLNAASFRRGRCPAQRWTRLRPAGSARRRARRGRAHGSPSHVPRVWRETPPRHPPSRTSPGRSRRRRSRARARARPQPAVSRRGRRLRIRVDDGALTRPVSRPSAPPARWRASGATEPRLQALGEEGEPAGDSSVVAPGLQGRDRPPRPATPAAARRRRAEPFLPSPASSATRRPRLSEVDLAAHRLP